MLGLQMKMGKVAAVRESSEAEKAGLKPGDEIKGVQLIYDEEPPQTLIPDARHRSNCGFPSRSSGSFTATRNDRT